MIICKYFDLFILYSFMGWIYETIYSTIVHHKFQSRGFLYGPIIPIYGIGGVIASVLFFELPVPALLNMSNLGIFTICYVGSIFLEYITSWLLEHFFHARWWDYSNAFLNINGRVCFFASCGFGVAGIIVVNWLIPHIRNFTGVFHPLAIEGIALVLMFLFGMDIAVTVSALTNFQKNLWRISDSFVSRMTVAYDNLEKNISEKKDALVNTGTEFVKEHEHIAKAVDMMGEAKDAISMSVPKNIAVQKKAAEVEEVKKLPVSDRKNDSEYLDNEVEKYLQSTTWFQKRALRNIKFTTYKGRVNEISEKALNKIRSIKRR